MGGHNRKIYVLYIESKLVKNDDTQVASFLSTKIPVHYFSLLQRAKIE
jgi:hypothetical protein